jgi:hypothetical protein
MQLKFKLEKPLKVCREGNDLTMGKQIKKLTPNVIMSGSGHAFSRYIGKIKVKPREHATLLLGSYVANRFSVELGPTIMCTCVRNYTLGCCP